MIIMLGAPLFLLDVLGSRGLKSVRVAAGAVMRSNARLPICRLAAGPIMVIFEYDVVKVLSAKLLSEVGVSSDTLVSNAPFSSPAHCSVYEVTVVAFVNNVRAKGIILHRSARRLGRSVAAFVVAGARVHRRHLLHLHSWLSAVLSLLVTPPFSSPVPRTSPTLQHLHSLLRRPLPHRLHLLLPLHLLP